MKKPLAEFMTYTYLKKDPYAISVYHADLPKMVLHHPQILASRCVIGHRHSNTAAIKGVITDNVLSCSRECHALPCRN
jgi:hypothetical protein